MRNLIKFTQLSNLRRRLLVEATMLVVVVRLGLWLLPLRVLRAGLAALLRWWRADQAAANSSELAWAVTVASAYVPAATCLTQALAANAILERYGQIGQLRIGVSKTVRGNLEAHAWVECAGQVIIGGSATSLARYTVLPPLDRGGS